MSSEVKTIFKVLLGTIALTVLISVFIELFNIFVVGMQLRQMSRMAARQACDLFTQETYKGRHDTNLNARKGTVVLDDILAPDGSTYVTGDFYEIGGPTTPINDTIRRNIWNDIYGMSQTHFKDFCDSNVNIFDSTNTTTPGTTTMKDEYTNLRCLYMLIDHGGPYDPLPTLNWNSSAANQLDYAMKSRANTYYDELYTAVNCGVPYLDETIVNRMYQYNLAILLMNGGQNLVQNDLIAQPDIAGWHNYNDASTIGATANTNYINYKGFKCYVDRAAMSNYEYTIFNFNGTVPNQLNNRFREYTNMSARTDNTGIAAGETQIGLVDTFGLDQEDNKKVTVVGITFNLPCNYVGITPIRKIFQWIMNYGGGNGVGGFNNAANGGAAAGPQAGDAIQWNETVQFLSSGGTHGNPALPNTGRLTYTLVR